MSRDPLAWLDPKIAPPSGFDVVKPSGEDKNPVLSGPAESKTKAKAKVSVPVDDAIKAGKEPAEGAPEPVIHVYMKWPESLKDEFDELFHRDKALRKRGKNTVLVEWCREGIERMRKKS